MDIVLMQHALLVMSNTGILALLQLVDLGTPIYGYGNLLWLGWGGYIVYAYIYTNTYIYIYIDSYIYIHMFIYIYICHISNQIYQIYIHNISTCINSYVHMYTCLCTYVSMDIHL